MCEPRGGDGDHCPGELKDGVSYGSAQLGGVGCSAGGIEGWECSADPLDVWSEG